MLATTEMAVQTPKEELREKLKYLQQPITLEDLSDILESTIKQDQENKLITFLILLLTYSDQDQQNISFKSESSTGKSYIPLEIAKYFPSEDVYSYAYVSPTAFFHEYGEWYEESKVIKLSLKKKILILGNYQIKKVIQKKFFSLPDNIFAIHSADEKIEEIRNKMKSPVKLGNVVRIVSFGLNTVNNKKYVSTENINDLYKPSLMGRDVGRYFIKNKKFVLYDKKILSRIGDEEAFNSKEKLVMQRIGSGLIATFDNKQHYCFNSTNMILKKDESYNLKYILALLNSKLINYYKSFAV